MSSAQNIKTASKDSYSLKIKLKSAALFTWFLILAIICLLPIYILIVNATREHSEIVHSVSLIPGSQIVENFKTVTESQDYLYIFDVWAGYKNSAIITISATFLTVFFSAMTAYGVHVYDFKFKEAAYSIILLVMMVPVQVTSAGFVKKTTCRAATASATNARKRKNQRKSSEKRYITSTSTTTADAGRRKRTKSRQTSRSLRAKSPREPGAA